MTIKIYRDVIQGTEEWANLRKGMLTASTMDLILTPTLKVANNEKTRSHLYELLAQRVNDFTEPQFQSFDMMRGHDDEIDARMKYSENYAPVEQVGFVTNDRYGFMLGFSPDGLVGDDGLIEIKSRKQKYQMQTILENAMPAEYVLQVQASLLISERSWCDFVSYCSGMVMYTKRIYPDPVVQEAIVNAATEFEKQIFERYEQYNIMLLSDAKLLPTERKNYEEISAS